MGYSLSWVAVKGKPAEYVRELLTFHETEQQETFPESAITATALPGDWYLIIFNQFDSKHLSDQVMTFVSDMAEAVTGFVEEHVMVSRAVYWNDGEKIWTVHHDAQQGIYHLQTSGKLPESFNNIRDSAFAEQQREGGDDADVDVIFDIPLLMAQQITGFKHDEVIPAEEGNVFTVLLTEEEINSKQHKPWWKFW